MTTIVIKAVIIIIIYRKFLAEPKGEKFENWQTLVKVINEKYRWSFFDSQCRHDKHVHATYGRFSDYQNDVQLRIADWQ